MTAKQRAARAKFKAVVNEAKKLRKKNPKLTQAQAVKQAWAISYSKAGKSKPKKVAAIKIIEKGESKKAKPKATYQQVRSKKGTFKGLRKVGAASSKVKARKGKSTEMHTDTKSHNVNIRVVSGIPPYSDADAAREIELYADNDSRLYFSRKLPILKNLQKKFQKGQYDIEKAAKLWMYYINDAMQRYHKEFGSRGDKWSDLLSVADRKLLAREYAKETLNEFEQGNFIV